MWARAAWGRQLSDSSPPEREGRAMVCSLREVTLFVVLVALASTIFYALIVFTAPSGGEARYAEGLIWTPALATFFMAWRSIRLARARPGLGWSEICAARLLCALGLCGGCVWLDLGFGTRRLSR